MALIKSFHNIDSSLQIQGDVTPKSPVNHNHYDLDPMQLNTLCDHNSRSQGVFIATADYSM